MWVFANVISRADYYVDLHGGDLVEALVPFTIFFRSGNAEVDDVSLEMAKVFGIHYLVCSETPGSTFCAASRAGIPSILAESGGQGIWTPEDVGLLTRGLDRIMRHFKMIGRRRARAAAVHASRTVSLAAERSRRVLVSGGAGRRSGQERAGPRRDQGRRRARAADGDEPRRRPHPLHRLVAGDQQDRSAAGGRGLTRKLKWVTG